MWDFRIIPRFRVFERKEGIVFMRVLLNRCNNYSTRKYLGFKEPSLGNKKKLPHSGQKNESRETISSVFYLKSLASGKTLRSFDGNIGSGDRSGNANVATESILSSCGDNCFNSLEML